MELKHYLRNHTLRRYWADLCRKQITSTFGANFSFSFHDLFVVLGKLHHIRATSLVSALSNGLISHLSLYSQFQGLLYVMVVRLGYALFPRIVSRPGRMHPNHPQTAESYDMLTEHSNNDNHIDRKRQSIRMFFFCGTYVKKNRKRTLRLPQQQEC